MPLPSISSAAPMVYPTCSLGRTSQADGRIRPLLLTTKLISYIYIINNHICQFQSRRLRVSLRRPRRPSADHERPYFPTFQSITPGTAFTLAYCTWSHINPRLLSASASRGPVFSAISLNGRIYRNQTWAQGASACDLFFRNILLQ